MIHLHTQCGSNHGLKKTWVQSPNSATETHCRMGMVEMEVLQLLSDYHTHLGSRKDKSILT